MKLHLATALAAGLLVGTPHAFAQTAGGSDTTTVAESAPEDSAAADSKSRPIPTLRCTFTDVRACPAGKACLEGKAVQGITLPMKVTADFESNIVASIDENGFARADEIDQTVSSAGQLIVQGVDGAFAWQMVIHDSSDAVSLSMQTADTAITLYGKCTK
ncbi:MAG: hypothetical protein U1E46_18740 [Hyphomicrobiales bacterium]